MICTKPTHSKDCGQYRPGTTQKLFFYGIKSQRLTIGKPKAETNSKPQDFKENGLQMNIRTMPVNFLPSHKHKNGDNLRPALTSGYNHKANASNHRTGSFHHHHHHHHHLSLNREGRLGTTDDFATSFLHFSLFSTALWDLENSRPVHSLMLSSHLFLCLPCLRPPFTVPCKMVLARPDERET